MDYARLGITGLKVSRICLGCMSYGDPDRPSPDGSRRWPWALREDEARPFFKRAFEAGINFLDTANVYSAGASEEVVGRAIKALARREDVVLATKLHGAMSTGPNGHGLSRKAIFHEIDASLRRLGTDYVDLYQIHRWDDATPIEETLDALDDVVRAGKVRYLGASSMFAWQFSKALHVADRHGWSRFVSMQNHYNLLYREEEREMTALCRDQGVGMIPWSPLARGRLARGPASSEPTSRSRTDRFGKALYDATADADARVLERLDSVAKAGGGASRAGCARLAPAPERRDGTHRWGHEDAPPRRRDRRRVHQALGRRDEAPRRELRAALGRGLRVTLRLRVAATRVSEVEEDEEATTWRG